jgi:hypothetical protein
MDMKQILSDPDLPDDLKVRLYNRTLDRFLNVRETTPTQNNTPLPPIHINWTGPEQQPKQQWTVPVKPKKMKTKLATGQTPSRKSWRLSKQKRKWLSL